jgi:diguanylate cyclase (GGDEF)-like protein
VLRHVGARMLDCLRGSDTVARLGGDEFAILFPATTEAGIERAIRKLRARLARGIMVGNQRRIVRVSLGYALADGEQGLDEVLKLADANMYRDKGQRASAEGAVRSQSRADAVLPLDRGIPDGSAASRRRADHSWSAL